MSRTNTLRAWGLALALGLGASVSAQEPAVLLPTDGAEFDFYGERVAAADDVLVVAATLADVDGLFNTGKLYVYEADAQGDWSLATTLVAPIPKQNDFLGQSLATDGTRIVAGSRLGESGLPESGALDIWVREDQGWVHEQRLLPEAPQFLGRWGLAVDIDGDRLVVGAPQHDVPLENEGEAWVFERGVTGWRLDQVLTKQSPVAEEFFGYSVAIQGDTVVVGVLAEGGEDRAFGGAYIFEKRARWRETAHLQLEDAMPFDQYGWIVDVDQGHVVVGTPYTDQAGTSTGLVRVYAKTGNTWDVLDELQAPEPKFADEFGRDVSLAGRILAVSSTDPDGAFTTGLGAVHLFEWNGRTYAYRQTLSAPLGPEDASFAVSIAFTGDRLLCGSPLESAQQFFGGAAWVFERD